MYMNPSVLDLSVARELTLDSRNKGRIIWEYESKTVNSMKRVPQSQPDLHLL